MNKILNIVVCILLILIINVMGVAKADDYDVLNLTVSAPNASGTFSVNGDLISHTVENLTLIVLYSEQADQFEHHSFDTIDSIVKAVGMDKMVDHLIAIKEMITNQNKFSTTFALDPENLEYGYYTVFVGGKSISTIAKTQVYYASADAMQGMYTAINNANPSNIADVLNSYDNILNLNLSRLNLSNADMITLYTEIANEKFLFNAADCYKIISDISDFVTDKVLELNQTNIGDVNLDGQRDIIDIMLIYNDIGEDAYLHYRSDYDGNKIINDDDAKKLSDYIRLHPKELVLPAKAADAPRILIESATAQRGEYVTLPVKFNLEQSLTAIQFIIEYDSSKLSVDSADSVVFSSISDKKLYSVNASNNGKIYINYAGPDVIKVKEICYVTFSIKSQMQAGTTTDIRVKNVLFCKSDKEPIGLCATEGSGTLKIPKVDISNNSGGNNGGKGNSVGNIIGTITNQEIPIDKIDNQIFFDIDEVPWAKESIIYLFDKNIINGIEDQANRSYFKPNDKLTRAQFIKMVVIAFGLEDKEAVTTFKDVSKDEWYYEYIAAAQKHGITSGFENGTFGVIDGITRQDMAVMLERIADYKNISLNEMYEQKEFVDSYIINDYAKNSIYKMQRSGIMNGTSDNTFSPQDMTTRAMAAKVIYSLLKLHWRMRGIYIWKT